MSLWSLVALPAVVGALLALAGTTGRLRRVERAALPLAVAAVALVLVLAVLAATTRPQVSAPFLAAGSLGLAVDGLSALVVVTVAVVALLVMVFALGDPGAELRAGRARFAGLVLVFVAAVMLTATATTLPALLLAWEVMGATSYALVGFSWREDAAVAGGTTAFLVTRAGDLGLYVAVAAALAGGVPGLSLAATADATPGWRHVVAAGVLLAALGKAAQLPSSFWLSRAMVGPSEVSALLHSAAMVAMGGYLLLRTSPLLAATGWAGPTTAWVGAATAVAMGAVALAQRDLKQLLAASTAAQLGFVVLAAGVGAVAGGTAHLVAHAATKALLFLAAGAWLSALGTKQLPALRGVARRYPLVGVLAAIGALSLAGLPPLALWATKDEVLAAARESSLPLYLLALAGAALSAGYAGKVLVVLWHRVPDDEVGGLEGGFDVEQAGARRVTGWQQAPLVVLAAGSATLGMLALPPLGDRLRSLTGDATSPTAGAGGLTVSAAVSVAVLLLTWRAARADPRSTPRATRSRSWTRPTRWLIPWLTRWMDLEAAAHALVVRPTLRAAALAARVDDQALDAGLRRTATATLALARATTRADDHGVDAAVRALARGVQRLAALARRPQSGLLHQYYLQAVAALVALVAVLLVPLVLTALS